ncbi:MAG: EFR1 family ferrodoxin [Clostridia bacterium]|nr:EFR1 family ferrodoxin [Clostridia bacterium]
MQIKRIRLIYFSATDTTKTTIKRIGKMLSQELDLPVQEDDFTLPAAREQEIVCSADELAVVGIPVYAGRVPNKLLPYVAGQIHGNRTPAVPVVLFGNRDYDDALIELRNVLEENGFRSIAGAAFVGEHSFSYTLGAGRPDAEDLLLADQFAKQIADKLKKLNTLPEQPVAVKGNIPLKPYYAPKNARAYLKVKPVVSDACTGCGTCISLCPMGSIDALDVRQYIGPCIKCGACIKKCPQQARYFDDDVYLYHKQELEKNFTRRADVELFL